MKLVKNSRGFTLVEIIDALLVNPLEHLAGAVGLEPELREFFLQLFRGQIKNVY